MQRRFLNLREFGKTNSGGLGVAALITDTDTDTGRIQKAGTHIMAEHNNNQLIALRRADRLSTVVLFFSGILLIGLAGRVMWLQTHITRADAGSLHSQHDVRVTLMARRASIYTADSTLIAGSVRVYNMFADPGYIFDPKGTLNALAGSQLVAARNIMAGAMARVLDENEADFLPWLKSRLYYANGSLRRFVWLKRGENYTFYHHFEMVKRSLIARSQQRIQLFFQAIEALL